MTELIQALLWAKQLLGLFMFGSHVIASDDPIKTEGNARLDAMVSENRGPNDEDREWLTNTRHAIEQKIRDAAEKAIQDFPAPG